MVRPRREDDVVKPGVLIVAGLALGLGGLVAFALRAPPDTPERIAKECRFIADREAVRMVRRPDYGPVPFEEWRVTDRTGGAPHPASRELPWEIKLLAKPWTRPQASIDCGPALDAAHVPKVHRYNEGPRQQIYRFQYSRVAFSPGDRYALARFTTCRMEHGKWDEDSDLWIWRRRGEAWDLVNNDRSLEYTYPGRPLPMRCFETQAD